MPQGDSLAPYAVRSSSTSMAMFISTANLVRRLEAAGLNPNSLDPWETWRIFKEFLNAPMTLGGYDSASFQWTGEVEADDEPAAFFVRQFTRRSGTEDVLV